MTIKDPLQFLLDVWEPQPHKRGYVFISRKRGRQWTDHAIKLQSDKFYEHLHRLVQAEGAMAHDLYFCPTVFSGPRRLEEYALPSLWLHADLDEVEPARYVDPVLPPTTAWMTSKGRYQCLWQLTSALEVDPFKRMNKALTYLVGADRGGHSITKALRIPGTINHKRERKDHVTLLWDNQQVYRPKAVVRLLKDTEVREHAKVIRDLELPKETSAELRRLHRGVLTKRALQLLTTKKAQVGERSERLWELECLLMECGIPAEHTLVLVRDSVWNKYSGQNRELSQLWAEVTKAADQAKSVGPRILRPTKVDGGSDESPWLTMKLQHYSKFMSAEVPSNLWAVEGIWSDSAHGFVAGEPKTFKSFIATDLAVAVASGTKFLGKFPVPEQGPVVLIQEENTPGMMKDRLEKITTSRGLAGSINGEEIELPVHLPIHMMNCAGLDLTDQDCIHWLDVQLHTLRPKLVVLDPLYMMIPGVDESSQKDLTPVLRSLLSLKQKHSTGMMIVHHYNKPRDNEDRHPGNRLSGSGVLYRWFESVIYLDKLKAPGEVKMTTEHRSHAPTSGLHLSFDIGDMGDPTYFVDVEARVEGPDKTTRQKLEDAVKGAGKRGVKAHELALELGVSGQQVLTVARRMGFRVEDGRGDGSPGRPGKMIYG